MKKKIRKNLYLDPDTIKKLEQASKNMLGEVNLSLFLRAIASDLLTRTKGSK